MPDNVSECETLVESGEVAVIGSSKVSVLVRGGCLVTDVAVGDSEAVVLSDRVADTEFEELTEAVIDTDNVEEGVLEADPLTVIDTDRESEPDNEGEPEGDRESLTVGLALELIESLFDVVWLPLCDTEVLVVSDTDTETVLEMEMDPLLVEDAERDADDC